MPRTESLHFDVCIIGCGPGGFAAAMRALDLGKHVCVVEKAQIGGAGVMWGALASKTMWELAKDFDVACQTGRGYRADAIAMRSVDGFVKIIVGDDNEQKILGMRAAGPQASSTIMTVAMLMDQDKGIRDVLKSVHPHPTMSEGIQECLRLLVNKSIYKPHAFPEEINVRSWQPESGQDRKDVQSNRCICSNFPRKTIRPM